MHQKDLTLGEHYNGLLGLHYIPAYHTKSGKPETLIFTLPWS